MGKIGIFGGSFNPIHNGHVSLCQQCDEALQFDRILLVPANMPPHKQAQELESNRNRFEMCELAVADLKKFFVCDLELKRSGKSYTIDTLIQLHKQYPNDQLYFIMGSDMFMTFEKWYRFRDILAMVSLVVGARHEDDWGRLVEKRTAWGKLAKQIDLIPISITDVSSTQIRKWIKKNDPRLSAYLHPQVLARIQEKKMYF